MIRSNTLFFLALIGSFSALAHGQEQPVVPSTRITDLVNFEGLSPEALEMQCGQKLLVVFVGHADLAAVYQAAPGADVELAQRLIAEYRQRDAEAARTYHQYLLNAKLALRKSILKSEPKCLESRSVADSSIEFYTVVDGPGIGDTAITAERAQFNVQSQELAIVPIHKNQQCAEFDRDKKTITFPDQCSNQELNIPDSLNSLLKSIAQKVNPTQTIYILKGHGAVGYRFATPRIKSLSQLMKSDYSFESFYSYNLGEQLLLNDARLAGIDFQPFSQQVRSEFEEHLRRQTPEDQEAQLWRNMAVDRTEPYSLHLMDVHGPDGEERGDSYFSPIWDKATACKLFVEEKRFANLDLCNDFMKKEAESLLQGPAERAQAVAAVARGALPFVGDIGFFGSKTQSVKGGFNQYITSRISRDDVIKQWAKIPNPPIVFRVLGKSLASNPYPGLQDYELPDLKSVGFPTGSKSASLLILDSCFGSTKLFRPSVFGHTIKPFEPANPYDYPTPARFDLPQRSLVQIFNNWPLFTDAIAYQDLSAAKLGLLGNSLYVTGVTDTPKAVWNIEIQSSLKELSDKVITTILGEKFNGQFDQNKVFRRLFAGLTLCKHDVGYERDVTSLDCKDEVYDSTHVHLETYKNRLEDFAQVITDYEQHKSNLNWHALVSYLSEMRFVYRLMSVRGLNEQTENLMSYLPVSSLIGLNGYAIEAKDNSFRGTIIKWAKATVETAEKNFAALDPSIALDEFKKLAWLNAVYLWKYRKIVVQERILKNLNASTWYTDVMETMSYLPNLGDANHVILHKANWLVHKTCALHPYVKLREEDQLDADHPVKVMLGIIDAVNSIYVAEFERASPVPLTFKLEDSELEKRMDAFQLKSKDLPAPANQAELQIACSHRPLGLMPLPLGR